MDIFAVFVKLFTLVDLYMSSLRWGHANQDVKHAFCNSVPKQLHLFLQDENHVG